MHRIRNRTVSIGLAILLHVGVVLPVSGRAEENDRLPATKPLKLRRPLDEVMVEGINRFALSELRASPRRRTEKWNRDYTSREAYEQSVAENRQRFRTIIGAVDERITDPSIELIATLEKDSVVAKGDRYSVHAVRWSVLEGVTGEGLLLQPEDEPAACVVALPDADWTPEMFVGLADGLPGQAQLPRRLAENGCLVLVPTLISRDDTYSGHPDIRYTNQPHREFIYRMAFEMGRHIIGYEVQKVLAAIDAFERIDAARRRDLPVGVVGVGEGGLLALYSAAIDRRIDAAMVCGYFDAREEVWQEPIYRNVWSLLTEFGDAEIASLIAPRRLVIEACAVPEVAGPPPVRDGRRGAAPGRIEICTVGEVRSEFDRAKVHYEKLDAADNIRFAVSGQGDGPAGTEAALSPFLKGLGIDEPLQRLGKPPEKVGNSDAQASAAEARQKRQFD